jgi:hypothetical protein
MGSGRLLRTVRVPPVAALCRLVTRASALSLRGVVALCLFVCLFSKNCYITKFVDPYLQFNSLKFMAPLEVQVYRKYILL